MNALDARTALVMFSGGQDSCVCLAWALQRYARVETVGFDYGQRHRVELECRPVLRRGLIAHFPDWAARLGDDHVLDVGLLAQLSDTALTQPSPLAAKKARRHSSRGASQLGNGPALTPRSIELQANGLPNTFVPGRNLLFLTLAAVLAYRRGASVLIGGMCETDYSGYPDCRDNTLKAMQLALSLGLDTPMTVETPLMWLTKADTWALGQRLGGRVLTDLVVEHSHTCYLGERSQRHAWGHGCGQCPACMLRAQGWRAWQTGESPRDAG